MIVFLLFTFYAINGCSGSKEPETIISQPKLVEPPKPVKHHYKETCNRWPFEQLPPLYIKSEGIMVTRVMSPCTTQQGYSGFQQDSNWMAMGFPCTGGPGRVEWKGSFYNPKMLSFIIANSCAMNPKDSSTLGSKGVTVLKLTPKSSLLAYYPFSIQYWELVDYNEADTGYLVEIRKKKYVNKAWNDFRRNIPIRLLLFGRENAWVRGRNLYRAEAELNRSGRSRFMLKIISARPVTSHERQEAYERCEKLKPTRNCTEVFAL